MTASDTSNFWRSKCCEGEACSMCNAPAVAKVGEEMFDDDPNPIRHNLTAYVCAKHFTDIMGPAGLRLVTRKVQ